MTNEEFVRRAYALAEAKDIQGSIDCFTPDGVFVDNSVAVTYTGPAEVAPPVEFYGAAFSDMHRELYDVYVAGRDWNLSFLTADRTFGGRVLELAIENLKLEVIVPRIVFQVARGDRPLAQAAIGSGR